ncbi:PepSY-associated TM helix domain-containing protein [Sphingobium sp. H33]|uniref:PepSY-associated TM helix domain-containing protein n=1 Tax=Sphingobium nicotianae TaxID=2782607 RepID=A0A9X1DBX4_9SPHN|nr:PepSY-associated TM helix domain-containing protein [Sphingobium nicotianae]
MDARTLSGALQDGSEGAAQALEAVAAPGRTAVKAKRRPSARVFWLKQLHTWHWVSAAISLIGMMLFAITGITLNHAASIGAEPKVTQGAGQLAAPLIAELKKTPASGAPIPNAVADEVQHLVKLDTHGKSAEWSEDEVYVALPGPGRDAWVSVDRASGAVTSELTDRGWISYLNDLHKGRNTGSAWFWFIDVFAVACILFTITGFFLLQLHARHRPSTWPLVGLGLLVPALLAVLFIH